MDRRPPHAGAGVRRLVCALALSAAAALTVITLDAQKPTPLACGVDLKLLVLSADGKEAVLPAITRTLDYLGTPYTLHIASQQPGGVTTAFLKSGCRGFYQGIIQTSASLAFTPDGVNWMSALTPSESQALVAYETEFRVRHANWYAFPTPDVGLFFTTATGAPVPMTFTSAGRAVFSYLSFKSPLEIRNSWTYLASPIDDATIPLIIDPQGNVLAAVRNSSDGREMLTMTFDGNANLVHTVALGYGVVNWVTRGLFIGERHVYMNPQVDDLYIHNDQWKATTPCFTPFDATGAQIRVGGSDIKAVIAWQQQRRNEPLTRDLRLTIAYNGVGTTGMYSNDTLTPALKAYGKDHDKDYDKDTFYWVSHTYTHQTFEGISFWDALDELVKNELVAWRFKYSLYSITNLVTPNVTGLTNADALWAAYLTGVRYIVTDTSQTGYDNPFPNIGIQNPLVSGIYMIPRRPTNLYFNVAAPADWAAEYNCTYESFWGRQLAYEEILDVESQQLLMHMLRGDIDLWMFHQTNFSAYDGTHTLLTDLLDVTLAKYQALYNLPVQSPSMDEVGAYMQSRAAFLAAGVKAFRAPDGTVTVSSSKAATVPLTGVSVSGAETYGGQKISYVNLGAGRSSVIRPAR